MQVLYVCTANICRSPSAAAILRDADLPQVQAVSAGTLAATGSPGCPMAPALEGRADQHSSQRLTADLIDAADLVLTAAREHRAEVVSMSAQARPKTFTVRQAGRLAQWLLDAGMVEAARRDDVLYEQGDPRMVVAPLPQGDQARTAWLVDELDAARGMAPAPSEPEPQRRWGRRATDDQHPDDVPDPHVLGMGWHGPAYDQLLEATGQLVAVVRAMRA